METFFASKRRKLDHKTEASAAVRDDKNEDNDGESTDFKIAVLASLHTDRSPDVLLDYLLAYDGSVEQASEALSAAIRTTSPRKRLGVTSYQSSLSAFARPNLESARVSMLNP